MTDGHKEALAYARVVVQERALGKAEMSHQSSPASIARSIGATTTEQGPADRSASEGSFCALCTTRMSQADVGLGPVP